MLLSLSWSIQLYQFSILDYYDKLLIYTPTGIQMIYFIKLTSFYTQCLPWQVITISLKTLLKLRVMAVYTIKYKLNARAARPEKVSCSHARWCDVLGAFSLGPASRCRPPISPWILTRSVCGCKNLPVWVQLCVFMCLSECDCGE